MKKSILAVAGVAAFAGVAMPFGFANAEGEKLSVQDTLKVTVTDTCTYGTATNPAADGHEYTGSGVAGALVDLNAAAGATNVKVTCNAVKGYKITPTFSGLTNSSTSPATTISYSGNPAAQAGSATWTAYYSKNSGTATAFDGAITGGPSAQADTYEFSYKVGLGTNQPSGLYTGTATYALEAVSE